MIQFVSHTALKLPLKVSKRISTRIHASGAKQCGGLDQKTTDDSLYKPHFNLSFFPASTAGPGGSLQRLRCSDASQYWRGVTIDVPW